MSIFNFVFNKKKLSEKSSQTSDEKTLESPASAAPPSNLDSETFAKLADISRAGYRYLKKGDLSEALSMFRQIIEIEPDNHYALVGIGDTYRKKLRFREAAQYYQRCLEAHPRNNYALFGLADCFRQQNQFHNAIDVWEEYLQYDDQNVTVLTRVADAYRKVKDSKRSEELYRRVLDIEPNNAYALTGLGHLHYGLHNYNTSLTYWHQIYGEQALSADIRVLTSIGNCYRKLKSFEEGTSYFEEALAKEETNFYALFGLADCYRGLQYFDKSLLYWNRILEKDPRNKIILTRAGDAYRHQQQLDLAEDYYERALSIKYDTYAVLGLATVYIISQRFDEAARRLEGLLKNHAQNYRIYPALMECYVFLQDRIAAVNLLEKFRELEDPQPQVRHRMYDYKLQLGI